MSDASDTQAIIAGSAGKVARSPDYKARRAAGEFGLAPKHEELATLMAHGGDSARIKRLGLKANQPLSVEDAARVVGTRLKNAREITRLPKFQKHYLSLVAALRTGEHGRSIHTLIEVRDDKGENSAADRKTRIEASKALLGEDSKTLTVNVGIGVGVGVNGVPIRPGFIIRQPAPRAPVTIDAIAREQLPSPLVEQPGPSASDAFDEFKRKWT